MFKNGNYFITKGTKHILIGHCENKPNMHNPLAIGVVHATRGDCYLEGKKYGGMCLLDQEGEFPSAHCGVNVVTTSW